MGQETGLSRVISQHSLAPFPGCFPGPLCSAVKALHACDHGDKTNHDGSAVKGSRLCKNKQTGLPGSQQSAPRPATKRQNGFPGMGCQVSHALPVTQLSGRRKKITICFAPHLLLFCKCRTGSEPLHVYMEVEKAYF